MKSHIKEAIDKSLKDLEDIQDKIEDFIDDVPDDPEEVKAVAKRTMTYVRGVLNKSIEQAGEQAEEAELQAHLGLMEAKEKIEASKAVVDDYVARASDDSKRILDEAQLKQHLAMMEARDFWHERGQKMAEEFRENAETMQTMAEKAVNDMQGMFMQFNDIFTRQRKD